MEHAAVSDVLRNERTVRLIETHLDKSADFCWEVSIAGSLRRDTVVSVVSLYKSDRSANFRALLFRAS